MTAVWLWVRADLRRRWRSWVVLGLLAGVSVGLACAGIAGARRTERALPNYARVSRVPDAAVLANDPGYDAAERAEVARLPEVKAAYPFVVPFALETAKPKGLDPGLVPATPAAMREMAGVIVEGRLPDALPLALAVFFALLAIATVAHALVTTVRRRRHDLAVLRSIGFTRRDARIAIAWQATLIAIVGLVVGIPLGIVAGRLLWKQLADSFPVAYVPPFALLGVLLVVPLAVIVANLIAAGPGHAATRIRPARVLRTE